MQRRMKIVCGSVFVTLLLGIGFAPAVSAGQNVCVSVDGVNYVDLGTADCDSSEGNTSVAVGEDSFAGAGVDGMSEPNGTGNTAVGVGDGSFALGAYGNGNTSIAAGDITDAEISGGNNNTAVAAGYFSSSEIYEGDNNTAVDVNGNDFGYVEIYDGDNNTAVAVGEDSVAQILYGDDNSLTVIDDGFQTIDGESGCFAVVIGGQVYGDADCLE